MTEINTIKIVSNGEEIPVNFGGLKCEVQTWTGTGEHTFTKTGAVAYIGQNVASSTIKIGGAILAPSRAVMALRTQHIVSSSVIGNKSYLHKEVA